MRDDCAYAWRRVGISGEHGQRRDGENRFHSQISSRGGGCSTVYLSKRVDVIQDRDLPQDHLADNMRRFDVRRIDRRSTGGTRGQSCSEFVVI